MRVVSVLSVWIQGHRITLTVEAKRSTGCHQKESEENYKLNDCLIQM